MSARSGRSGIETLRLCVAALAGIVLIVLLVADASGSDDSGSKAGQVVVLTEYDLLSRADTLEPRPYWVGRQPGTERFELEVDAEGSTFVRYAAGADASEDPLTVATYVVPEARERLERAAREAKEPVSLGRGDGITTFAGESDSAYVVFDELPEVQVEVYSPDPGVAKDLVLSGAVTPLHWTPLG